MSYEIERIGYRLRDKLNELPEFDGDASWFKDNAQLILEIIELADEVAP